MVKGTGGEGQALFATFSSYLKHERSVLNASQDVYIHRNTLLYRIRKIKEFLESDLDDAYTRNYMRCCIKISLNFKDTACKTACKRI